MKPLQIRAITVLAAILFYLPAFAVDKPDANSSGKVYHSKEGNLGVGPTDVGATLKENERRKASAFSFPSVDRAMEPWFDWKKSLDEQHGFKLGADYQTLYSRANDSPGEDDAFGGAFRLFGKWAVLGRGSKNPGTIVFKTEHRHAISTNVAPEELGSELGYVGIVGTGYGDFELGVTDFYWKQQFWSDNTVELRIGRLAPTAYFDGTLSSDPYSSFINFSLMYTPTVAYPADGSLGVAGWAGLTQNLYALITVLDANSRTTHSGFDTIDEEEYFTGFEFGWADRGAESSLVDNVHLTVWHADARQDAGTDESKGVGLTASWLFDEDKLYTFFRAGWSDGGAAMMEHSVATGVAINLTERNDLLGIGASWGKPFGDADSDQYTTELFYRYQLAQNLALTADLQYLINPALHPDDDDIMVLGLRTRITF